MSMSRQCAAFSRKTLAILNAMLKPHGVTCDDYSFDMKRSDVFLSGRLTFSDGGKTEGFGGLINWHRRTPRVAAEMLYATIVKQLGARFKAGAPIIHTPTEIEVLSDPGSAGSA